MRLATATLVVCLTATSAWAQNPDIIQNTRDTMKAVQLKKTIDVNNAVAASQGNMKPAAVSNHSAAPTNPSVKPAMVKPEPSKPPVRRKKVSHIRANVAPAAPAKKKGMAAHAPAKTDNHIAVEDKKNPVEPKKVAKNINLTGRRDPFISPVVNRSMTGSGCSTGKRCLAIDQISLKGIVKSDTGMIAVVVNALDKAYFLHENDPVFNGFVVKITPDSIVFKESMQDRLGKPFTREVTKRISTPAV